MSIPYNFPNSIAVNSFTAAFDPPLPARQPAGRRIDWKHGQRAAGLETQGRTSVFG